MDHISIVKKAWEITWKHKALWLFGFLLALVSGGAAGGGGRASPQYTFNQAEQMPPAVVLAFVAVMVFMVALLIVVAVIINVLARGALIGMVNEIEEAGQTSVRSGFRMGWSRFLPLLGINLAVGIPAAIVAIPAFVFAFMPLVLLGARKAMLSIFAVATTVILVLGLIGLLVIGGIALGMILELAYRRCVLDKQGVLRSIRDGFRMARDNLSYVAVLWLLLFGLNIAVGIAALGVFLVVLAAAAIPVILMYAITHAAAPTILTAVLLGIPAAFLWALAGGVYKAFQSATWTLAYRELKERPI